MDPDTASQEILWIQIQHHKNSYGHRHSNTRTGMGPRDSITRNGVGPRHIIKRTGVGRRHSIKRTLMDPDTASQKVVRDPDTASLELVWEPDKQSSAAVDFLPFVQLPRCGFRARLNNTQTTSCDRHLHRPFNNIRNPPSS